MMELTIVRRAPWTPENWATVAFVSIAYSRRPNAVYERRTAAMAASTNQITTPSGKWPSGWVAR